MAETLRLVRVFLASPGDLQDERRVIKDLEEEFNGGIAKHLGFRIEIDGWEDTLSGSGRPQSIINQELERCELFIGLMSRRWGTPPAEDGPYTSGFEEEFHLSSQRLKKTGKPEMAMYFKKIPSEFLVDKGDDLKKVLEFKERIVSERSILFQDFEDSHALQLRVRQKIQKYLMDLNDAEEKSLEEQQAKTKKPTEDTNKTKEKEYFKIPFSKEGHDFLKYFLGKTESEDSDETITPLEVARVRLLSSTLSKSGNDEPQLGVHDANIIYSHKDTNFGFREISRLVDCGLKNIAHENVPLWHWYGLYEKQVGANFLAAKSIVCSDDNVGSGALEAMKLIGSPLSVCGPNIDRNNFIQAWLSEHSPDSIKLAALRYLKHHGKDEDLPLIQSELARANYQTSREALESIVSIQLRYNEREAVKTAFENQFESFDETLIRELLAVSSQINEDTLILGLSHKDKRIRLESFTRLKDKKKLNSGQIQELKNDPSAIIRKEVVDYLITEGQSFSDEEVKGILVRPESKAPLGGLFGLVPTNSVIDGEACYEEYLFSKYYNMSEKDLLQIEQEGLFYDYVPYFALCCRYFKNHSEELRENIDDRFRKKFETYIERMKNTGMNDELIKKIRDIQDYFSRKLTRKALDILCEIGETKDLGRIRENMRSEYTKSSAAEIEYFQKVGKWEDVAFIVKAEKDLVRKRSILAIPYDDGWHSSAARSLYAIGKDRIDELLNIEIPGPILIELIKLCSSNKFSEITDNTLLKLLDNKVDKVRKFAALKIIQTSKKTKLKSLFKEYLEGEDHRYYNVIFWLDFGVTMPKSTIRKAASIIYKS